MTIEIFNSKVKDALKSCKVLTSAARRAPGTRAARALHMWRISFKQDADGVHASWPCAKHHAAFAGQDTNPQYYFETRIGDATLALVAFMDGSLLVGRVDYAKASAKPYGAPGISGTDRMISFAPFVFGFSNARHRGIPRLGVVNPARTQLDARLKAEWPEGDEYGEYVSPYVLKSGWGNGADWKTASDVESLLFGDLELLSFLAKDPLPTLEVPEKSQSPTAAIWPDFLPHCRAAAPETQKVKEWAQNILDQMTILGDKEAEDFEVNVLARYPYEQGNRPPEIYLTYRKDRMRFVAEKGSRLLDRFDELAKITPFPLPSGHTGLRIRSGGNPHTIERALLGRATADKDPSGHRRLHLERLFGEK